MCLWDLDAKVVWSAEMVLPLKWPSQNELGANNRGYSGWRYRKFKARFEGCLRRYAKAVAPATGWRRAYLVRRYGKGCRGYDDANLRGGGKALIDAMVGLGYLKDDRPGLFLGSYHQERSSDGKDSILIRLEETDQGK